MYACMCCGKAEGSEGMLPPGHRRSPSRRYLDTKLLTNAKYFFVSPYEAVQSKNIRVGNIGMEVLQFHACIAQAASCKQPR